MKGGYQRRCRRPRDRITWALRIGPHGQSLLEEVPQSGFVIGTEPEADGCGQAHEPKQSGQVVLFGGLRHDSGSVLVGIVCACMVNV